MSDIASQNPATSTVGLSLHISGMTCNHCVSSVTETLKAMACEVLDVNLDSGLARISPSLWLRPEDYQRQLATSGFELLSVQIDPGISLPVQGMSCQKCVARITLALGELSGVDRVEVDLETNQVRVFGVVSLERVIARLVDLDFRVEAEDIDLPLEKTLPQTSTNDKVSIDLQVQGMSCASCVATVERTLAGVTGVSEASVNFADESAHVEGKFDLKQLLEAVSNVGYEVIVLDENSGSERDESLKNQVTDGFRRSALALGLGSALMSGMWFDLLPKLDAKVFWIAMGLAVLLVMVICGGHFFRNALKSARYFTTTMDTLIALGTGTAWLYSMLVIVLPTFFPESSQHLFFEAALFIIGFVNLGKSLELNARGKASSAIEKLLSLTPDDVTLVVDGEEVATPLVNIKAGDLLRIKPGERIPVDGVLVDGYSSIDESMMSGEPIAVDKQESDALSAGTINLFGSFVMRAEQVGNETTLARMIAMVKHAQNTKPPIGRITDSIAGIFVPVVLVIALLTGLYWGVLAADASLGQAVVTSMSVLIIACPCALGLAIPMSIMVGMGKGASNGLLIRNSDALQAAASLSTVILDKTGTLTEGKPEVVSMTARSDESRLLELAYSLESLSEHPLASAIIRYCEAKDITRLAVESFQIAPGGGIKGLIDNREIMMGNATYLVAAGVKVTDVAAEKGTTIYVAESGQLVGFFSLDDALKEDSKMAVSQLKAMGIKVVILSGDNLVSTRNIAQQVGITDFYAGLSPEDKLQKLKKFQETDGHVAMVGDGINDAPALGAANVGFAMGSGADIAIESADVAIVGNRLSKVVEAVILSRQTMRNIYQNLVFAFAYNIVLIPVAAGILSPILISPSFAGLAMAMSSLTVVTNANRLRFS